MALKKELEIVHKENSSMYILKFSRGGELPDMLKSEFTSFKLAARQRDLYYISKKPKKAVAA